MECAANTFELDGYLARIGYTGECRPCLACLNGIMAAHAQSIPFENLDVLLDRGISLEADDIYAKLVTSGRGGYCFEQNSLLMMALEAIGFKCTPLSARVRLQKPREETPARTHLFLRVDLEDGPWLADVGVGGLSLTSAIRFGTDEEQSTPHENRRITQEGGRYFHQALLGQTWSDVCEFTGEEMPPIDREVANWFTSAHPNSHFRNRLMVARAAPQGGRYSILNDQFTIRDAQGRGQHRPIHSATELVEILAEFFGLSFPQDTRFGGPDSPWPT